MKKVIFKQSDLVGLPEYDSKQMLTVIERLMASGRTLFTEKDAQYGGSWQKDGLIGAFLNLKRKMDRLLNKWSNGELLGLDEDSTRESITDTFVDMNNYSYMMLGLMFLKSKDVEEYNHFVELAPELGVDFYWCSETKSVKTV